MICYSCGCRLTEKDFCTGCGADVKKYKKIMYSANRFYNDGLEKAQVRDLSGAIISLRQCLKLNKNHIEARNLIGLIYFERGEVVAALSEWVISKNIRSEKNIADDYISMISNNPGRLDTFNQTIKKYNLALNYCHQDSLDLAVIQLKKVISMNPRFVQARQLLALLYINGEEWEKAKKELDKALRIDANNTTTLRYLKEVESKLPSEEDKTKKRKDVIVYQSGNDTVIQPVTKKEHIGLQTLVNIMIGVLIGVGISWYLVVPARIKGIQNNNDAKYKIVSEQLDSKTVLVDELTAKVNELTAEKEELSNNINNAEGKNSALEAYTNLIEATLMYINESADKNAIAEELELIPDEYIQNDASESFNKLYEKLMGEVGEVVATECYNIGYEAFRTEDYETAISNLERAFKYDPTNGEALYNLGNAYNKKGDTKKAIEVYEQVVEKFPDSEKAKKAENYIKEIKGE